MSQPASSPVRQGERRRRVLRSRPSASGTLPESLRRACSRYTGIVRSIDESLCPATEPPLFRVAVGVGRGRGLLGSPLDHLSGIGGSGRSRSEAAAAAVGEAIERYSATYIPHHELVLATAAELAHAAVDPARFALFSELQYATEGFPFARFTSSSRLPWVRGWSLADDCPAWLPAELVYLGEVQAISDRRIGYATSSGAACGASIDEALARALCELLERDAFMIAWANRLSLPRIDVSADRRLRDLDQRLFASTGLRYCALDLSCFHRLPSVLGVVRAPAGVPGAVGVGAGTAPTLERAWWKGLAEAFAARAAGATLALVAEAPLDDPRQIVSFEDHIRYYADHAHADDTSFLDAGRGRSDPHAIPTLEGASAAEQVEALRVRVEAAGASAYAVDVTAPDVRELGLVVVKVVAPELCSLDVPHAARHLGGRRLYDEPVRLGLRPDALREDEVNPAPHPFP